MKKNNNKKVTVKDALFDLPHLGNGANTDVMPYPIKAKSVYSKAMRGTLTKCSGNLVSKNSEYVLERYKFIQQGENWESIPKVLMKNYSDPTRCHTAYALT